MMVIMIRFGISNKKNIKNIYIFISLMHVYV